MTFEAFTEESLTTEAIQCKVCNAAMAHQEKSNNDGRQDADACNEVRVHTECCGRGVGTQEACPAEALSSLYTLPNHQRLPVSSQPLGRLTHGYIYRGSLASHH